jgi:diguanylate cyclase (GGDEF)-like protein
VFAEQEVEARVSPRLDWSEALLVFLVLLAGIVWSALRHRRLDRELALRRANEAEILSLALQDPLTGLANRRAFDAALSMALRGTVQSDALHALLLLDLNGFKRINDVFGHAAGDELLIAVSTRLRNAIRPGDMLCRLGGDEFVVLLTEIGSMEGAVQIARRIITDFRPAFSAAGREHLVGMAIGISAAPTHGADSSELLRKADIALYRSKKVRGSSWRIFEEEMAATIQRDDALERDLRAALIAKNIYPTFQPIVDIVTGKILCFEALARWKSPTFGIISPEIFVPIAEEAGLIGELTEQVLLAACSAAIHWPRDVRLAVNISPMSLRDESFVKDLLTILRTTKLDASRLELEITECALVEDLDAALEVLGQLRSLGVRIALDDFGTGYSSLYHLSKLRVDKIKIDKSFVLGLLHDRGNKTIIRAVLGMGAALGLEVVAEGVETAIHRKLLMCYGCQLVQGYYYSKAVSEEAALDMLRAQEAHAPRGEDLSVALPQMGPSPMASYPS